MTVQYQIDGSIRRITTRGVGDVTIEEVLVHFDDLSVNPS